MMMVYTEISTKNVTLQVPRKINKDVEHLDKGDYLILTHYLPPSLYAPPINGVIYTKISTKRVILQVPRKMNKTYK